MIYDINTNTRMHTHKRTYAHTRILERVRT